ncbi:MAG: hypothetical protein ABIR56_00215 [Polaromonas sp.]
MKRPLECHFLPQKFAAHATARAGLANRYVLRATAAAASLTGRVRHEKQSVFAHIGCFSFGYFSIRVLKGVP